MLIVHQVNDARSYDLTLDLYIDRPGPGVEPNPLKRRGTYNLSQQCFKCVVPVLTCECKAEVRTATHIIPNLP